MDISEKGEADMNSNNDKFYFTVAQLIEILKAMPQNLPVLVSGYNSGYENFNPPRVVGLTHKTENMYRDGEFQPPEKGETAEIQAVVLDRAMRDD